jgi:large subunit ribosomal protein L31e
LRHPLSTRVYLLSPQPPSNPSEEKGERRRSEMSEKKRAPGPRKDEVVTREYTVNLHKRLHGWYRPPSSHMPSIPELCAPARSAI